MAEVTLNVYTSIREKVKKSKLKYDGETIADVLKKFVEEYPLVKDILFDENGIKSHFTITVNTKIVDRKNLSYNLKDGDNIHIFPPVAGGAKEKFYMDLHIHSRFSRATSAELDIPTVALWAKRKGVRLIGTGDFTHPMWFVELSKFLKEYKNGVYEFGGVYFILTCEVSCIFKRENRTHKIHFLITARTLSYAERISKMLSRYSDISFDGRPAVHIDPKNLIREIKSIDKNSHIIPAHAWTPHYSIFGSNSGFNSLEECFGELKNEVFAIESGLSSDPPMNRLVSFLDDVAVISNSDAHSGKNIAREANYLYCDVDYERIFEAIRNQDKESFLYTVEFYPEEGKYHYDGHRDCLVSMDPLESIKNNFLCKKCGEKLTIGVLSRIYELKDRTEPLKKIDYRYAIPLIELISDVYGLGKESKKVQDAYFNAVERIGELELLLNVKEKDLTSFVDESIATGIINMRMGRVEKIPGFDGVYGKIKVMTEKAKELF